METEFFTAQGTEMEMKHRGHPILLVVKSKSPSRMCLPYICVLDR